MKRLLLLYIICVALFACSDDNNTSGSDESDTIPTPTFIDIVYNGSAAEVTISSKASGVTCSSGTESNVVITADTTVNDEYIYRVSGSSDSGSLTINGSYKMTVLLAGVSLTSTDTMPAVNINCGKRINVILQEDTESSFVDNTTNCKKGAFYSKGHLEFEGGGTMNVTGNTKHALCCKEYMKLKKTTGTINILGAVGDGIHCGKGDVEDSLSTNNHFKINGGTLNFSNVSGDLIDCDDYGVAYINGGTLNLTVDAYDSKGLKADSLIYIEGGTINLDITSAESIGIQSNYAMYCSGGTITGTVSGTDAIGLKANISGSSTTVMDDGIGTGNMFLSGTNISLSLTGSDAKGLRSDRDMTITGGTISLSGPSSNSPGYKCKGTLTDEGSYMTWTSTDE